MATPVIVSVGELLVEFVSHRKGCGLRKLSEYSGPYPSGAPAIFIDQAARMGAKTHIFGGLGADNFGNSLIDRLQENGVETGGVRRFPDKTTGVAFVSYYEDGTRTFIFHLDDTAAVLIADAEIDIPDGPAILHVSGSSLGNPALRTAIEKTSLRILEHGGKISCDPNARAELMQDPEARAVLDRIVKNSSYLFPSTSDFDFLFPGLSEQDAAEGLRSLGAEVIALKRGAEGCTIFSDEGFMILPGHNVEEVDPTGAGDCFCGTFVAMIAQGHSISSAGRYANAAGALAVMHRGPMEGNSNTQTIETFLATVDS